MRHFLYLLSFLLMFTSCNDNLPELEKSTQKQVIPENLSTLAQENIDNEASQKEYLSDQYNFLALSEIDRNKLVDNAENGSEEGLGLSKKYNNLGNEFYKSKNYEIALFYYLTSLDLKLDVGNDVGMALSFRNIALTYQAMGDYRNAAINFWQSYCLYKLQGDASRMAKLLNDLGIIYDLAHDFVHLKEFVLENSYALSYYSQSIDLSETFNNSEGVLQTELNIKSFYNTYLYRDTLAASRTDDVSRDQDDVEDEI